MDIPTWHYCKYFVRERIPFKGFEPTDAANLSCPFQSSYTTSCPLSEASSSGHKVPLVALARTTESHRERRGRAEWTRPSRTREHHVTIRPVCATRASSCSSDARPNTPSFTSSSRRNLLPQLDRSWTGSPSRSPCADLHSRGARAHSEYVLTCSEIPPRRSVRCIAALCRTFCV